jgi:hypothetical protein
MVEVVRQRKGEQPEVIGRVDGEELLQALYYGMPGEEGTEYTFWGEVCSKGCNCTGCGSGALCKDGDDDVAGLDGICGILEDF